MDGLSYFLLFALLLVNVFILMSKSKFDWIYQTM
jgi:hypothetical protein